MDLFSYLGVLDFGVIIGVLVFIQLIRETLATTNVKIPKIAYRWGSLVLGAAASIVIPVAESGWRVLGTRALIYAGATLIVYSLIKDPLAAIRKRFSKDESVIGKPL